VLDRSLQINIVNAAVVKRLNLATKENNLKTGRGRRARTKAGLLSLTLITVVLCQDYTLVTTV